MTWHPHVPGEPLPSWRDTALDNPNLQFSVKRIRAPLWEHMYQQKLNKILNDASELAVSTAYADRMARWVWWDNLEKIFADILNAALLVVTPFVPFLRLTTDVVDGIPGTLDEVEVYGAYQTGLKARLDLPWLADHMLYRAAGNVEAAQLVSAYNKVIEDEQGDGLTDQMLEQYFWSDYLRNFHTEEYAQIKCQHHRVSEAIDALRLAQNAWAAHEQLPPEQKSPSTAAQLRQHLIELADTLNVPQEQVLTGAPMDDEFYGSLFLQSFHDERELSRQLTRQAMVIAGI